MGKEKIMKPVIKRVAKVFKKHELTYNQTKYIFRAVRYKLSLKPPRGRKWGTVIRLSQTELNEFIKTAFKKGQFLGLMMTTLYETAARVSEFVNFKVEDLYSNELRLIIQNGKGGKRREVPISGHLALALKNYIKGQTKGYIFESNRNFRYSMRRIQQLVKGIAAQADIIKKVTPHILRHTRATLLAERGMSKDHLQVFLGHEKPETTQIYTYTAAINVQKEFQKAIQSESSVSLHNYFS